MTLSIATICITAGFMKTLVFFLIFFTFSLSGASTLGFESMPQWFSKNNLTDLIDKSELSEDAVIEVTLDESDERLNGVNCPAALFSKQANQKVWGRSLLKVQCLGTDNSPFYIYAEFNVWAPVLVVKKPIQKGQTVDESMIEYRTMNLTDLKQGWVKNIQSLQEKTPRKPLWPGTTLHAGQFIGKPLLAHGDTVKVIVKGNGFQVASSGLALEEGSKGEIVKIKTSKGEILHGVAVAELTVEVSL